PATPSVDAVSLDTLSSPCYRLLCERSAPHRDRHSFPTRRSSDLPLDAVGQDVGGDVGRLLDRLGQAAGEIAAEGAGAVAGVADGRLVHVGVEADELAGDLVVRTDRKRGIGFLHSPTLATAASGDNPSGSRHEG